MIYLKKLMNENGKKSEKYGKENFQFLYNHSKTKISTSFRRYNVQPNTTVVMLAY